MPLIRSKIENQLPPEDANVASSLLEAFDNYPDRTLLVDAISGQELNGARLALLVRRLATNLINLAKLEPGQVVMTLCDHNINELILDFGIIVAGGSLFPVQIVEGFAEWLGYCNLVRPDVIVAQSCLKEEVLRLKKEARLSPTLRILYVDNPMKSLQLFAGSDDDKDDNNNNVESMYHDVDDDDNNNNLVDNYFRIGQEDRELLSRVISKGIENEEQALIYILTSGSTSRPKLVKISHNIQMFSLYSMIAASKNTIDGRKFEQDLCLLPMREDDVFAGDLPLDHGAGINTILLSIMMGCKLVVMPSYDVDTFWRCVNDFKITISIASTSFLCQLLLRLKSIIDSRETLQWDLSSLRLVSSCGAKLVYTDLVREIKQHFKNLSICQCYGCTEVGFISMSLPSELDKLDSVGYLFPGIEAKVVDPQTNRACRPNEPGELRIMARSNFKTYICHPDDEDAGKMFSRCHDDEGFYLTGDKVHYDDEGRFYIHGRYKDTLVLAGDWKIVPSELEELINKHPLVEMSVVVGLPDSQMPGFHLPRAYVKLFDDDDDDYVQCCSRRQNIDSIERDIYEFVAQRAAEPKHLKGGVVVLEEFPRVGLLRKIDRKALKSMCEAACC